MKLPQMKQIIEFTKNWKHRDILHVILGFVFSFILSLIFSWYYVVLIVFMIANIWELNQIKYFKVKYSISDVVLTMTGCILVIIIKTLT